MHGTEKANEKGTNEGDFHISEVYLCLLRVILSLPLSYVNRRFSYFYSPINNAF